MVIDREIAKSGIIGRAALTRDSTGIHDHGQAALHRMLPAQTTLGIHRGLPRVPRCLPCGPSRRHHPDARSLESGDAGIRRRHAGGENTRGSAARRWTPAQETAWRRIEELARPFHEADKLLFGVPLWNFGIPYKLKHLIDVISQKDVLFTFDGTGFAGKLTGKKAAVVYARGLDYASPGVVHTRARIRSAATLYGDVAEVCRYKRRARHSRRKDPVRPGRSVRAD